MTSVEIDEREEAEAAARFFAGPGARMTPDESARLRAASEAGLLRTVQVARRKAARS